MTEQTELALRQQLSGDIHRPRYHFLPPSNWMNDPNGVIQWKGQYHLFYQHNPNAAYWGDMHWGHAVSPDLIHWTDLPFGLTPTPNSADETGVFSGCCIDNNGIPTIFYTSTRGEHNEIQTQSIATSHDDLLTWQKHEANPIIDQSQIPAESGQLRDFRDPFVWKEGETWYMVLGSRIQDVGGAIFLYRSNDLLHWEYLHPLLIGDIKRDGVIWECPNFFELDGRWVLIISTHTGFSTDTVIYYVGSYENQRFTPAYVGVLDYDTLYAPLSFVDDRQRRILFGWLRESRPKEEMVKAGWSGVQSIPRVLRLDGQDRLLMTPVPELEKIRGQHHRSAENVHSLSLDIVAEFDGDQCGLSVYGSPDNRKRVEIIYENQRLAIREISEGIGATRTLLREMPHELAAGETLKLRVLLDGSVLEVIANERTSITSRIYPAQADHNRVQVIGAGALRALDIWEMPSIWQ